MAKNKVKARSRSRKSKRTRPRRRGQLVAIAGNGAVPTLAEQIHTAASRLISNLNGMNDQIGVLSRRIGLAAGE